MSKGALYLEFATKDDLFTQVVYREFRLYLQDALARVQNDPEGGRLSRIYRHCLAALLQREFLVSLYTDTDGALTGLLVQHGPERYGPRVVLGETFLARLQQAGLVTPTIPAASLSHTLSVQHPFKTAHQCYGMCIPPVACDLASVRAAEHVQG